MQDLNCMNTSIHMEISQYILMFDAAFTDHTITLAGLIFQYTSHFLPPSLPSVHDTFSQVHIHN